MLGLRFLLLTYFYVLVKFSSNMCAFDDDDHFFPVISIYGETQLLIKPLWTESKDLYAVFV